MSELVDPSKIEDIVGIARAEHIHFGKLVSDEGVLYILHPFSCLQRHGDDLRQCPFSLALDNGLNPEDWDLYWDDTVALCIIQNSEGSRRPAPSFRFYNGEISY